MSGKLWILPLEPLEERYTRQWREWVEAYVRSRGIRHEFIDGEALTDHVGAGKVLDATGTNYWKASQMVKLSKIFAAGRVASGDRIFTFDMWHPGLESVPYMAQLLGIGIEIYGFLFAGSYTDGDFTVPMAHWARHFECGWAAICTKVFFGSGSHLADFRAKRDPAVRGVVTGQLFNAKAIRPETMVPVADRANRIGFPHRWDAEKRPDLFISDLNALYRRRHDFEAVIMTGRRRFHDPENLLARAQFPVVVHENLRKSEYHEILASCKVVYSAAEEETFGYAVTEGLAMGCHVVAPDRLSYSELIPKHYLYRTQVMAQKMLAKALDHPVTCDETVITGYEGAMERIFTAMGY